MLRYPFSPEVEAPPERFESGLSAWLKEALVAALTDGAGTPQERLYARSVEAEVQRVVTRLEVLYDRRRERAWVEERDFEKELAWLVSVIPAEFKALGISGHATQSVVPALKRRLSAWRDGEGCPSDG